jgi:hypothetical protein
MAGNGKDDPPSDRPHVWSFAAVTLAAAIGAAASIVVAVQKGRYDDNRHDLEARIRTLEADHAKDQSRIETLTSQLAAARGERGRPGPGATPKGSAHPAAAAAPPQLSADPWVQRINDYVFTLDACKRHGPDLDCWIVVRNDDADRQLQVTSESRLIAEDGTTYHQTTLVLGDQETFLSILFMQLPTGVPVRFGLHFKGLAVKVRHLSLVEVVTPGFRVQFRDVDVI